MRTCGNDVVLIAMTADRAWPAPVHQRPIADPVTHRGGVLIAITCGLDPIRLSTDARYLGHALGAGEILLGWASLSGSLGGNRQGSGKTTLLRRRLDPARYHGT
ncbi:MAG TPA: hypothetical protein VLW50_31725 [Streptosporangiaceae bacterium]|nr:hypothetical protein [Streptosporangiaceae bacterium]